jgi:hypothetical protein
MRLPAGELKNIVRAYLYAHSASVTGIFTQAKRDYIRKIYQVFHILINKLSNNLQNNANDGKANLDWH